MNTFDRKMTRSGLGYGGNTVTELLSDYGANGLRVMRFVPIANPIEVRPIRPAVHMPKGGSEPKRSGCMKTQRRQH